MLNRKYRKMNDFLKSLNKNELIFKVSVGDNKIDKAFKQKSTLRYCVLYLGYDYDGKYGIYASKVGLANTIPLTHIFDYGSDYFSNERKYLDDKSSDYVKRIEKELTGFNYTMHTEECYVIFTFKKVGK
ncbi:hypothetical protein SAP23_GM000037 [Staphylococcus phage SAP23]|nr:hypothetical protein SAP23_GM000037 [Staphylococcus phage SAP23]